MKSRGGFICLAVSSLGQCKIFARINVTCATFRFQLAICCTQQPPQNPILSGHTWTNTGSDATITMLKAIKKSRAKKAVKDRRLADPAITHMDKEQCQDHLKNKSKEKTFDGLDVTWSISTGQSSDQDIPVSASAATPLRRNIRERKIDEPIHAPTASEELPSLAGPSMASSLRRLRLKADLQLAKQKLELMNHYANDPDVPTATTTTNNNKYNAGDTRTGMSRPSPGYPWQRSNRLTNRLEDDYSLITKSSRLPVDMTCDAYVADDMIEAGALAATCGIMSNFRPIFGSLLEEEEGMVTDDEDGTVNSRGSVQSHLSKSTFVNNTTKPSEKADGENIMMAPSRLSRKSDRETILMAPSRYESQHTKLAVDSDDIHVVIGKYGRYVLVST